MRQTRSGKERTENETGLFRRFGHAASSQTRKAQTPKRGTHLHKRNNLQENLITDVLPHRHFYKKKRALTPTLRQYTDSKKRSVLRAYMPTRSPGDKSRQ